MRSILLDAGPQIALFAVDDKYYHHYDNLISKLSGSGLRLITTWPCVVEASYLLGVPQRYELLRWIELGGVLVYPFGPHHLTDIVGWMENYTEVGKREIMTIDVRDFTRYRLPDGQAFSIL